MGEGGMRKHFLNMLKIILGLFLSFCLFGPGDGIAGDVATQVKKPVSKSIDIRKQTQKKEDAWASERAALMAEYQSLEAENDRLTAAREELKKRVMAQRTLVNGLERRHREIQRITKELIPFMEEVYQRLVRFIEEDTPFLDSERQNRLATLRRVFDDAGVTKGEKYRKLMEALFVETEYGNTVEVYQKKIDFEGSRILVDVFRLGRISLFFQSLDGETIGYFDPADKIWKRLPEKFTHAMAEAIEMGSKRRPVDLVDLPLGKVVAR